MFKGAKKTINTIARVIANIIYAIMVVLLVWFIISVGEVVIHNMFSTFNDTYEYWQYNLFTLLMS